MQMTCFGVKKLAHEVARKLQVEFMTERRGAMQSKGMDMPTQRKVLVVDTYDDTIEKELVANGDKVVHLPDEDSDIGELAAAMKVDAVVVAQPALSAQQLESFQTMFESRPVPVALFIDVADDSAISMALNCGVSAIVVDARDRSRARQILRVAFLRFEYEKALREEATQARIKLADRRDVEKAKAMLMESRGINEETAYSLLRETAMMRQRSMGDLARQLLETARLITV